MLALYRTGHVGAALDSFAQARQRLVDHLGTDLGVELDGWHRRILRRDAALTGFGTGRQSRPAGAGVGADRPDEAPLTQLRVGWFPPLCVVFL
ncbi:hypothetical protein Ais01nite_02470 [Asanoa ishikariensis]|uniref:BTAD domain-containing putative transcriptional regulator n=1 Tax=Asanoa ishikariensis TaxID=137265 RepID=UPI0015A0BE94|nr:BTAD domain-containing putative transcriptional regulator [Asanoa ishikariensis]GIF62212.1 hypothetical protein Ais01nite_02470 [Asanoa ishikariensis]